MFLFVFCVLDQGENKGNRFINNNNIIISSSVMVGQYIRLSGLRMGGLRMRFINQSPVILLLFGVSLGVLLIGSLMGGGNVNTDYFTAWPVEWKVLNLLNYRSTENWARNIFWIIWRLHSHVLGHVSFSHFFNNYKFVMLVGPAIEHEYGSKKLIWLLWIVALISGGFHSITAENTVLCGASGIVFSFVALSTRRGLVKRDGVWELPIALVLVIVMFVGQEVWEGLRSGGSDGISQMSHIIGAVAGIGFAIFHVETKETNRGVFQKAKAQFYYYTPSMVGNVMNVRKKCD